MISLLEYLNKIGVVPNEIQPELKKFDNDSRKIIEHLLTHKIVARDTLRRIVAEFYNVKEVILNDQAIPRSLIKLIPETTIREKGVIIFKIDKEGVKLAISDPHDFQTLNWLSIILNKKMVVHFAFKDEIVRTIEKNVGEEIVSFETSITRLVEKGLKSKEPEAIPIIKILDLMVDYAVQNRASDIHIEPHRDNTFIRFRIDGILHNIVSVPKDLNNLIISRIKIIANLRTDLHHKPQDGKFRRTLKDDMFDVRVSILPTINGEKAVLRILKSFVANIALEDLAFSDNDLHRLKKSIEKPHGMILSTGPTGSGKTTTLYTVLRTLNTPEVNISTIEDPVEYELEGISQIQVNQKAGLTFASGLRSIVRQDPDIIMVGEIRDEETAEIAINSALTGHLVLSTLHTNDAATAFPRLTDLKIKPFLTASSINIVIGQRLARKICDKCIQTLEVYRKNFEDSLPKSILDLLFHGENKKILFKGKGCPTCNMTGYLSRIGIYEVLEVNDGIKDLIVKRASANELTEFAIKTGMATMLEDGVKKVLKGLTTIDELIRIVG